MQCQFILVGIDTIYSPGWVQVTGTYILVVKDFCMFLSSGKISPRLTFSSYSLITLSRVAGRHVNGTGLVTMDLGEHPIMEDIFIIPFSSTSAILSWMEAWSLAWMIRLDVLHFLGTYRSTYSPASFCIFKIGFFL